MKKVKSYKKHLLERLKTPKEAPSYINTALEDHDFSVFLLALRDLAEAYGGVAQLAKATDLNRDSLYRTLSLKGNPNLFSLLLLFDAFGIELSVKPSY